MRGAGAQRQVRAPVRLRVLLDGVVVHEEAYRASGLFDDGQSIAIARISVVPGRHTVRLQISDRADADEWPYEDEREVAFEEGVRRVAIFDNIQQFRWH